MAIRKKTWVLVTPPGSTPIWVGVIPQEQMVEFKDKLQKDWEQSGVITQQIIQELQGQS